MKIFLFELDSVRNSKEEISLGQKALYKEIVQNGHQVVLSFNQLTDSLAFLGAIARNPEDEDAIKSYVELFRLGVFQISPGENKRSVSEYLVQKLESFQKSGRNGFLFSGVPVIHNDNRIITAMIEALRYDALYLLREAVNQAKRNCQPMEQRRLEYLYQYTSMIKQMGTVATGAMQQHGQDLPEIIKRICRRYSGDDGFRNITGYKNNEIEQRRKNAIKILRKGIAIIEVGKAAELVRPDGSQNEQLRKLLQELREDLYGDHWQDGSRNAIMVFGQITSVLKGQNAPNWNHRSTWYDFLNHVKEEDPNDIYLARVLVDLCYNYSLESSVPNLSSHCDFMNDESFSLDLENRLELYFSTHFGYPNKQMSFYQITDRENMMELPHWADAVKIRKLEKGLL